MTTAAMNEHDRQMLAYLALAWVSDDKQQTIGRDRFWILAGVAACRAGYLDVAARCRELVIASNPRHLLSRYASIADALRDAEFEPFLKQLERFCAFEQAEHFLRAQGVDLPGLGETEDRSPSEIALTMLPSAGARRTL